MVLVECFVIHQKCIPVCPTRDNIQSGESVYVAPFKDTKTESIYHNRECYDLIINDCDCFNFSSSVAYGD